MSLAGLAKDQAADAEAYSPIQRCGPATTATSISAEPNQRL